MIIKGPKKSSTLLAGFFALYWCWLPCRWIRGKLFSSQCKE